MFTYRQLLAFHLILAIWCIQLTPFAEYAHAQDQTTDSYNSTPEVAANPAPVETPRHVLNLNKSNSKKSSPLDSSAMLQISVLAFTVGYMLKYEKSYEVAIAGAGAILYIMGLQKLYKEMQRQEKNIKEYEQGIKHDYLVTGKQREGLLKALEVYTALKKAADKKAEYLGMAEMMFQLTFIVGAIIAIYSWMSGGAITYIDSNRFNFNLSSFSPLSILISDAEASDKVTGILSSIGLSAGGYAAGSAAATYFGAATMQCMAQTTIANIPVSVYVRLGIWVAATIMMGKAKKDTEETAKKLQGNIDKINEILMRFATEVPHSSTFNAQVVGSNGAKAVKASAATAQKPTTEERETNEDCIKDEKGNCFQVGEIKSGDKDFDFSSLIGSSVMGLVNDGRTVANLSNSGNLGMGSGDLQSLSNAKKRLAKNAPKIEAMMKKTMERYNTEAKKNGQPTIDFKANAKKEIDKLMQSTSDELAKAGIDPNSIQVASLDIPTIEKNSSPLPNSLISTASFKPSNLGISNIVDEEDGDEGLAEDPSNDMVSLRPPEGAQDVAKDHDLSIFTQISNRYIETALPRFLRRKNEIK